MSNYPPGVSGNEYQIAGPEWEDEIDHPCPTCESIQPGLVQAYGNDIWWICYTCDNTIDDISDEYVKWPD